MNNMQIAMQISLLISVHYPFHDRVIGDTPQVRARIDCFARSLTQVSASLKQNKPRVRPKDNHHMEHAAPELCAFLLMLASHSGAH